MKISFISICLLVQSEITYSTSNPINEALMNFKEFRVQTPDSVGELRDIKGFLRRMSRVQTLKNNVTNNLITFVYKETNEPFSRYFSLVSFLNKLPKKVGKVISIIYLQLSHG